jgi:hypothetical protein
MEKPPKSKKVKRAASRSPTETAITCRPYVSCRVVQTSDGVMRNFSSHGSYVETSGRFKSGTILIVRMLRYPTVTSTLDFDNQPRTICLAEVKWCRKLIDGKSNRRYGMGLKYLD